MEQLLGVIGENVRFYRKKVGLSQEKLAEEAGLHRTYVGGVERGDYNISVASLLRIAQALDVEPFVLFIGRTDTRAFMALAEHVAQEAQGQ